MAPVYCLHCGTLQDDNLAQWSVGPEIRKAHFTCPKCGWLVEAKAQTRDQMMRQMDVMYEG